jgi:hypothetical protein
MSVEHCLGGDRKCTCMCGKGLRPEFSALRDERGRICADCQAAEVQEKAEVEYEKMQECICLFTDFIGYSVCGVPCPAHQVKS